MGLSFKVADQVEENRSIWQASQPTYGGIQSRNPDSNSYANDTLADITRAEYDDYQTRFQPYEQKLMSLADSEALLDEQLSRITASGNQRFKKAQANSALMNQRYGVQTSARQQNYNNTQLDAQRGLSIANAKNMSRLSSKDRQLGILTGSSTTRQLANDQG